MSLKKTWQSFMERSICHAIHAKNTNYSFMPRTGHQGKEPTGQCEKEHLLLFTLFPCPGIFFHPCTEDTSVDGSQNTEYTHISFHGYVGKWHPSIHMLRHHWDNRAVDRGSKHIFLHTDCSRRTD